MREYARLAADPPGDLSDWERRHLDRLAEAGPRVLDRLSGDTLVHLDLRADNVLFGASGRTYFVDWPWASRGPAWVDTALFLINVALYGGDPESHRGITPCSPASHPSRSPDCWWG